MTDLALEVIRAALPIQGSPFVVGDRRVGLIVVDEINGFCTPGSGNLAPPPGEQPEPIRRMIQHTNGLARAFVAKNLPVLAFLDTHEPGKAEPPYPPHCERGTGEEDLVPELAWLESEPLATLIRKDVINGFVGAITEGGGNLLVAWLNAHELDAVVVVGICTDICSSDLVVTTLSARNHRFDDGTAMIPKLRDVVVFMGGNATYDLPASVAAQLGLPPTAAHPAEIAHHVGLWTMQSRGAFLASEIVEA